MKFLKKLRDEVHKDLPKVFIKGEWLNLDCLIDFVFKDI